MTPAHHSLFKWWLYVDLDLFYSKVKFGNIGLSIGKSENCWFFRTFAACDLKPIEIMKICEVKIISWPWPKVIYIWKLKLAFLRNDWAILNQILFCAWPKYQVSVSQDHWSSGHFFFQQNNPWAVLMFGCGFDFDSEDNIRYEKNI